MFWGLGGRGWDEFQSLFSQFRAAKLFLDEYFSPNVHKNFGIVWYEQEKKITWCVKGVIIFIPIEVQGARMNMV